jgi:hypothetical protein
MYKVIITRHKPTNNYVAQGIEHDVCCQAKDLEELKADFDLAFYFNGGAAIPAPPEYIIQYIKDKHPDFQIWDYNPSDFNEEPHFEEHDD